MKNKILIVDDVEINRNLLTVMLEEKYEIITADNGKTALEILEREHDDIVLMLLDLVMPQMDGFQVLEKIRPKPWSRSLAVIIITSENTSTIEKKCFDYGVSDFIHRPFDAMLVQKRVSNIVSLYHYQEDLEEKIVQQTETILEQLGLLQEQAKKLRQSKENIIDILGTIVEYRNLESGEHIKRVKQYTSILAERMMERYPEYNLDSEKIDVIVSASALHDIGKIAIPDSILLKPAKLTPEEFECMKTHTTRGGEILNNIKEIWDKNYETTSWEICMYHHERWDGRGYPKGLNGDEIPVSAQIVSIADVYDALISKRVYKGAFEKQTAFEMIINGECGVFSPKLLECFKDVREEFEKIADDTL